MKKKQRNEEILSRRKFFKNVVNGVLPILGAVVLSQIPVVSNAHESKIEMGCNTGCRGGCRTLCEEGCSHSCNGSCKNSCDTRCNDSCKGSATTYWK